MKLTFFDTALIGKAISHSATAYSPHTITKNAKSQAVLLAHKLNCYFDDKNAMIECLKQKDAKSIVEQIPALFVRIIVFLIYELIKYVLLK